MATIDGATSFTQQVLAVWTDGKTTCAVRPPAGGSKVGGQGQGQGQDQLMPFQYRIPINKYNTLHSIAVKRSASAANISGRQQQQLQLPNNDDNQRTRVFATTTRIDSTEMSGLRSGNGRQQRHQTSGGSDSASRNTEVVERLSRQLDQLRDQDSSTIIRILREQMDDLEKENQSRQQQQQQQQHQHHHHYQQQQPKSYKESELKMEEKGVQADWMLLLDTEAELISRQSMRLSVPDLTRPRQRIGSKSHSVDDDDAGADDEAAKNNQEESMAEELKLANDRLVSARLREANLLAHLKDYRSRTEDLRRLISLRESHIERLDDEILRLKDALVEGRGKEKEMQSFISDLQLTLQDLHSKYEEFAVLGQLRDAEHSQVVENLEKQIAKLQEEKRALTFGQPPVGYQATLSKNAVHFQSTGCLVPANAPAAQNSDKATRGHRSVESSPSTKRCVRYKEAAQGRGGCDWDAEDEILMAVTNRVPPSHGRRQSPVYAAGSPNQRRRSVLHDKVNHVGGAMRTSASFNGRCMEEEEEGQSDDDVVHVASGGAACRPGKNNNGSSGESRAGNIPAEGESDAPRTRSLVRKASYICGIQQHSVLDDITDSVD